MYAVRNIEGTNTDIRVTASDIAGLVDKTTLGLDQVDNTSDINKPVSNATQLALDEKQDTLVSGTNIKTLSGQSLLGSGDLADIVASIIGTKIIAGNNITVEYNPITKETTISASGGEEPGQVYDPSLFVAHIGSPYISFYKQDIDSFTKMDNPDVLPTGSGLGLLYQKTACM